MGTRRAHERLERLANQNPHSTMMKKDEMALHHLMHRVRFDLKKAKERFGNISGQVNGAEPLSEQYFDRRDGQLDAGSITQNASVQSNAIEDSGHQLSELPTVHAIHPGQSYQERLSAQSDDATRSQPVASVIRIPHTLQLWSDGSVVKRQHGGAAFVCLDGNADWSAQQLPLGRQIDVLKVELIAAQAALEYAEGILKSAETSTIQHVILHTDCSNVEKVLLCEHELPGSIDSPSRKTAAKALIAVKARLLFRDVSVEAKKVSAHTGVPGNESADVLAVGAARQSYVEASSDEFTAGKRARKAALKVTHGQAAGGISWMDAFEV